MMRTKKGPKQVKPTAYEQDSEKYNWVDLINGDWSWWPNHIYFKERFEDRDVRLIYYEFPYQLSICNPEC